MICTGGNGYLGSVLVPQLLRAGHDVVVVDTQPPVEAFEPAAFSGNFRFVRSDIRDIDIGLFQPGDSLIHLAGLSNDATFDLDPRVSRAINVDATLRLAALAQQAGVKHVVFASSCSVYGALGDAHVDESSAIGGVSEYARSKAECEAQLAGMLTLSTGLTCLRFGTLFGLSPRTRFDLVVNRMTQSAVEDRRVVVMGGGRQWRPLLHVRDAARAIQTAIESSTPSSPHIFNVVGENTTMLQLGELVANQLDVPVVVEDSGIVDPRSYSADSRLISKTLGFEPTLSMVVGVEEIRQALVEGSAVPSDVSTAPLLVGKVGA